MWYEAVALRSLHIAFLRPEASRAGLVSKTMQRWLGGVVESSEELTQTVTKRHKS
jgi:hypothetical protein